MTIKRLHTDAMMSNDHPNYEPAIADYDVKTWWRAKDGGHALIATMSHDYLKNALRWCVRNGWMYPAAGDDGPACEAQSNYLRFEALAEEWRRRYGRDFRYRTPRDLCSKCGAHHDHGICRCLPEAFWKQPQP